MTRRKFLSAAMLLSPALLRGSLPASGSVGNHQAYVNAGNSFTPFWELGALPEFRCVAVIGREKPPRGSSCVLIAPRYILTSAHAFIGNEPIRINEGERFVTFVDSSGKLSVYRTTRLFVPQGYLELGGDSSKWRGPMDIAIAELDRPVDAPGVSPAIIFDKVTAEPLRRVVVGVGYGIRGTTRLGMSEEQFGVGGNDVIPRPFGFQLYPERFEQPEKFGDLVPVTTHQESRNLPLSGLVTAGDSGGGYFVRTLGGWRLFATTCYSQAGNDGRFAKATNYDGCETGILTLARFAPAIRRGLNGDWSQFSALRLADLPTPQVVANRVNLSEGELQLQGVLEAIQGNDWIVQVSIVTDANGKQTILPKSRPKIVHVTSDLVVSSEPKPGARVTVIGADEGKGKPLTARIVEIPLTRSSGK
jgi:hypothetical protein